MATLDPVFGLHAQAMAVQRQRMDLLASNIANADTPNYQARDIDFAKQLAATLSAATPAAGGAAGGSFSTDPRHLPIGPAATGRGAASPGAEDYRVPVQPSADGNTVDVQVEQAKFADAALHYQASLNFADGRLRSLLTAITGQ